MRNLLWLGVILSLNGCSQAYVDNLSKAEVSTSSFDGGQRVGTKPMPARSNGKYGLVGIAFGAHWTQRAKDFAGLDVEAINIIDSLQSVSLNVDGTIKTYNPTNAPTDFKHQGAMQSSRRTFLMPVDDLKAITNAKDVKYRVVTMSNGSFEGFIINDTVQTAAYKSIKNTVDAIPK